MTRRPVPSGSVHSSFLVPFKIPKGKNEMPDRVFKGNRQNLKMGHFTPTIVHI